MRNAGVSPGASEGPGSDPLAAVRSINASAQADSSTLLVLVNFHRFLQSAEVVQALITQLIAGKQNRTFVLILSPVIQLPTELEKLFTVVEHPLPGREQLYQIATGIATGEGEIPVGTERHRLLDAATGLTRYEAENAFSLSLVRHARLTAETLWELKAQMLKKSGLLQLHRGDERFDDLGGLDALKAFCKRALRSTGSSDSHVLPRGVLLLSPPGCGKSQFCKALGNETRRPTLLLDVGTLLGSLVGQSEANIRQALKIVDAMAPAVVFLDEIDKAFSGVNGSRYVFAPVHPDSMTNHRRDLREFELVAYMLNNKPALFTEFFRVVGDAGGCRDHSRLLDRCIINAILAKEFPTLEPQSS